MHVLLNGYKVWEDLKSAPFPRPTHATVWILNNFDKMKSPTLSALLYVVVFVYLFIQLFGFSISLSISNILDNFQSHNQ